MVLFVILSVHDFVFIVRVKGWIGWCVSCCMSCVQVWMLSAELVCMMVGEIFHLCVGQDSFFFSFFCVWD